MYFVWLPVLFLFSVALVFPFSTCTVHSENKNNQHPRRPNKRKRVVSSFFQQWHTKIRATRGRTPTTTTITDDDQEQQQAPPAAERGMGQAMRIMSYDYSGNKANAVASLNLLGNELHWCRLDDGVMGGISETRHTHDTKQGHLHFTGIINTQGGGFASIRTPIPASILAPIPHNNAHDDDNAHDHTEKEEDHHPQHEPTDDKESEQDNVTQTGRRSIIGLKFIFQGDGKTYKILLSDGNKFGGPFKRSSPSWQVDFPTTTTTQSQTTTTTTEKGKEEEEDVCEAPPTKWEERIVLFSDLRPSFGPRPVADPASYVFHPPEMQELGIMLSLLLSNGQANPPATFGAGIFDFQLIIKAIEPVYEM